MYEAGSRENIAAEGRNKKPLTRAHQASRHIDFNYMLIQNNSGCDVSAKFDYTSRCSPTSSIGTQTCFFGELRTDISATSCSNLTNTASDTLEGR